MWNEKEIEEYLKSSLKNSRFVHSINVRDTAIKLAILNGVDEFKARIAGLVHDCGKNISDEELLEISIANNIEIDEIYIKSPQLLHGEVGAVIAKKYMGIDDDEILNAIRCHTTGKLNMTKLEKIIYIADYIEPSRNFPGVEELRSITYDNLDKGLLKAFDTTIKYVIDRGQLIHKNTIESRNFILLNEL